MEVSKAKYYYHVTCRRWPKTILLRPRSSGYNRSTDEPKTARICVSPTVEQCLVALCPENGSTVFRTKYPIKYAKRPREILDSIITREKWLTKPTLFVRIGKIKEKACTVVRMPQNITLGDGTKASKKWQRKALKRLRRMNGVVQKRR